MKEYVVNECLLPSLMIGVPEDVFWKKTPKTLGVYFKAYNKKQEMEVNRWSQKMWIMGQYVRSAIASSIFVAGLYDGKHKVPDYPKFPQPNFENNLNEKMTEQEVKNERLRCYAYFKSFSSK